MADSKCADTDEGKGVGEITQHYLKQFKEALNKEHDLSALHNRLFFLNDTCQRLLQHDQDKRYAEHDDQDRRCRKRMSCQVQQDHNGQCPVEDQAADCILVKQDIFRIAASHCIDDMEDHGQQYEEHTEDDRHNKHSVHVAKAGYIGHGIHRPQPYGFQHIFKSEDTAEHESKESGKDTGCAYDGGQIHFFEFVKQKSADSQQKTLSHIAEHGAEDEGIGDCHEHGGVHLIVGGKAVHFNIHLKRFENLGVFQLGRRLCAYVVLVILNDTEQFGIIFNVLLESQGIPLGHPSAEDIEGLLVFFDAGRYFSHVKVGGEST